MPDREKVTKGIWQCWMPRMAEEIETQCIDCPYYSPDGTTDDCMKQLRMDALVLLKEKGTKTGKWIEQEGCDGDVYYDCSVCDESWVTIEGTPQENGMLYCPHCGAKMEGR